MARRGNGSNFWSKFGPFLKTQSGTFDLLFFFVNSAEGSLFGPKFGPFPKSNRGTLDFYDFLIIFYILL